MCAFLTRMQPSRTTKVITMVYKLKSIYLSSLSSDHRKYRYDLNLYRVANCILLFCTKCCITRSVVNNHSFQLKEEELSNNVQVITVQFLLLSVKRIGPHFHSSWLNVLLPNACSIFLLNVLPLFGVKVGVNSDGVDGGSDRPHYASNHYTVPPSHQSCHLSQTLPFKPGSALIELSIVFT